MEPVTTLFLQNLGVSSCLTPEDSKKICKAVINLYDQNKALKNSIHTIKTSLNRAKPSSNISRHYNGEDLPAKLELDKLKSELKDSQSENEELKKMIFGVDCSEYSLKDACRLLFGEKITGITTLKELRDALKSHQPVEFQANSDREEVSVVVSKVLNTQKEVFSVKLNRTSRLLKA